MNIDWIGKFNKQRQQAICEYIANVTVFMHKGVKKVFRLIRTFHTFNNFFKFRITFKIGLGQEDSRLVCHISQKCKQTF